MPVVAESGLERPRTVDRYLLAVLRLAFAWEFLWAFSDKLFGWGFATPSERSWLNGGSPTRGFLENSAAGPFESFYRSIAGDPWANWLFMLGLLGIGVALLLGVMMRVAVVSAVVLLVMMWSVALPPANNPFLDEHLIQALALILLVRLGAGDTLGLGRWWAATSVVRRFPFLR
ncbi:MAG TPA: DoxX family membrane protein [Pseudonocardiaceae bacterium]|nr:DoxX family membrane protein [Pseudonocardiaceae bacterium]